jgi:RHS repeat-associated protein
MDDEVKGDGNSYDFGARMYDSRLGRWLSIDPLAKNQPDQSPYKAFYNSPLIFSDPDGKDEFLTIIVKNEQSGKTTIIQKPTAISTKVMTNGSGSNEVHSNNYYDFETIVTMKIDKNGKVNTKISYKFLYDNGLKDFDVSTSAGVKGKYSTKSRSDGFMWGVTTNLEGKGDTQRGGVSYTSKDGGASPTKYRSLTGAEERDIDLLLTTLPLLKGGSLGNKVPDLIKDFTGLVEKTNTVNYIESNTTALQCIREDFHGDSKKDGCGHYKATDTQILNGDTLGGKDSKGKTIKCKTTGKN